MPKLYDSGVFYKDGELPVAEKDTAKLAAKVKPAARENTLAARIIMAHSAGSDPEHPRVRFDALASHDITYVGIIQTARSSGLERFPVPYVLTNCHNSLCAVGGTINEDDHLFGLSAAKKYGGEYVPAHIAVIHQYMRERYAGGGKMILGSDSHTRYGALGTMGVGEGGPELVKQLLGRTWDVERPKVILVYLTGAPVPGVGPQDAAIALIGAVFKNGYVKNAVLEFAGPGVGSLSAEYRMGIDVMTTETACLSSVWETDATIKSWLSLHGREDDYRELKIADWAYYDGCVAMDLSKLRPMIALPCHPSNAVAIDELLASPGDVLRDAELKAAEQGVRIDLTSKVRDGKVYVDQGVIAGCAGGMFENICAAADILEGGSTGDGGFSLSVYPSSQPVMLELTRNGAAARLMDAGAIMRSAFCGPCFGAGDVPANGCLSIRHTTRNFPSREGAKPGEGQSAAVALMDARSIAATARNGGLLTPATALDTEYKKYDYHYDDTVYRNRCYRGWSAPKPEEELRFGPNITPWPEQPALPQSLLLGFAAVISDPVTTTDELIPSGETSSFRSNPLRLAEFALSRKDPQYVPRAKKFRDESAFDIAKRAVCAAGMVGYGSVIYAVKPGDGSAREQAASCQRVLGGCANLAREYATKRYRSNLINWGMLPLLYDGEPSDFEPEGFLWLPDIRSAVACGAEEIAAAYISPDGRTRPMLLGMAPLTEDERKIVLAGCLMNYYRDAKKE